MATKRTEVRMNIVSLICGECGVGEMKPTGVQFLLFPPLYQHICDKCGAEQRIESPPYPRIEYETIAAKVAVESVLAMKNIRPCKNNPIEKADCLPQKFDNIGSFMLSDGLPQSAREVLSKSSKS